MLSSLAQTQVSFMSNQPTHAHYMLQLVNTAVVVAEVSLHFEVRESVLTQKWKTHFQQPSLRLQSLHHHLVLPQQHVLSFGCWCQWMFCQYPEKYVKHLFDNHFHKYYNSGISSFKQIHYAQIWSIRPPSSAMSARVKCSYFLIRCSS